MTAIATEENVAEGTTEEGPTEAPNAEGGIGFTKEELYLTRRFLYESEPDSTTVVRGSVATNTFGFSDGCVERTVEGSLFIGEPGRSDGLSLHAYFSDTEGYERARARVVAVRAALAEFRDALDRGMAALLAAQGSKTSSSE